MATHETKIHFSNMLS